MNVTWWQGLILGLVQGITEFLPISSSGHLVLAERLVGFKPDGVFLEVMVHLATLLSVFIAYRRRIGELLAGLLGGRKASWRDAGLLLLASVPAAAVGLLFRSEIERIFHAPVVLGFGFLLTAVLLWTSRRAVERGRDEPITVGRALLIGVGQAVAILPAVSRSGTTIVVALWSGVRPAAAAEFSFLMSVVVIAGTGVLQLSEIPPGVNPFSAGVVWAFMAALVSGVAAIRLLVRLLRHGRFHVFAPYCAVLAGLCLIWFGLLGR